MILPRVRGALDRSDALAVVELIGSGDPSARERAEARLSTDGIDALLDDPRLLNALLTQRVVRASPELIFYVLVRQSLLECGVTDRITADYVTSLVLAFGEKNRAYRVSEESEEEFHYFVDLLARLADSRSQDAFLLNSHMGNHALWLTGLFPDYIQRRVTRRGAPPLRYYEELGSSGFRGAAECREAKDLGMDRVFSSVGKEFSAVRSALNRIADRYLWRNGGNPVERLLREVSWTFPRA